MKTGTKFAIGGGLTLLAGGLAAAVYTVNKDGDAPSMGIDPDLPPLDPDDPALDPTNPESVNLPDWDKCHALGQGPARIQNGKWVCSRDRTAAWQLLDSNSYPIKGSSNFGSCPSFKYSLLTEGEAFLLAAIARVNNLPEICTEPPRKWGKTAKAAVGAVMDDPRNRLQLDRNDKSAEFFWDVNFIGKDGWKLRHANVDRIWMPYPKTESEAQTTWLDARARGLIQPGPQAAWPTIYVRKVT